MRFALLVVLTVALASVAVRIDSHSSPSASRVPPATSQPGVTGASSGAPGGSAGVPGGAPAGTPAGSPGSGSGATHPRRAPHRPRTAAAGGAVGGSGRPVAQLPVTGWDSAWKLGAVAFAFVLIGGGMLSIGAAGRRRRPQPVTVQD